MSIPAYRSAPNDSQRKMAMIPAGAQVIDAGDLWFPVVIVENVHVFPGIPKLLQKKFHSIKDRFSGVPFQLRRMLCCQVAQEAAFEMG